MSFRTLQRYQASDNAPRGVYLTLWFESRWSIAALHTQAYNEAQHARAWVAALERECERLRGVIHVYDNAQAHCGQRASLSVGLKKQRRDGVRKRVRRVFGDRLPI